METVSVTPDYYGVLEVNYEATQDDVRNAYKRLARLRHPDKHEPGEREAANAAFCLLGTAYATLGDEAKRRTYDAKYLKSQRKPDVASPPKAETSYAPEQLKADARDRTEILAIFKSRQERETAYYHTRQRQESRLEELERRIELLRDEIRCLDDVERDEMEEKREANSLRVFLFSPLSKRKRVGLEERREMEVERVRTMRARELKRRELRRKSQLLQELIEDMRMNEEDFEDACERDELRVEKLALGAYRRSEVRKRREWEERRRRREDDY